MESVFRVIKGQGIAMDGEPSRGSHEQAISKQAIHLVNAWASANEIALGQRKVDGKSNEIRAIPELLRLLVVSGWNITIEAIGCQTKIAQAIRAEKADDLLRVKDNQSKLRQGLEDWFADGGQHFAALDRDFHQTLHKTSGRVELRRCWRVAFEYIRHDDGWADLNSLIRVQRERREGRHSPITPPTPSAV